MELCRLPGRLDTDSAFHSVYVPISKLSEDSDRAPPCRPAGPAQGTAGRIVAIRRRNEDRTDGLVRGPPCRGSRVSGLAWALGAQGVNPALGTGLLAAMLGTSTALRRGILRIAG